MDSYFFNEDKEKCQTVFFFVYGLLFVLLVQPKLTLPKTPKIRGILFLKINVTI